MSGKEIVRRYDEWGPIQVFDDGNKRTLMFGANDEQGCILKHQPSLVQYQYIRAMLLALCFESTPRQIGILGMGSGALAHALWAQLPQAQLWVVELRPVVIELAYSHFFLPRDPRLQVVTADAIQYLKDNTQRYDLLFADLYLADGLDQRQASEPFLELCLSRINTNGWLVLNYWQSHKEGDLLQQLTLRFSQVWTNNIDGENWIIFASNCPQGLSDKDKKLKVHQLNRQLGFSLTRVASGLAQYQ